ncbi:alpha/beta hydrolase [Winogradskyella sp. PC-19]|uniref:alpha/beta fold hydrolase n=1 Tax=unclassified Winogradskyella TaxID=2615021 RepID=UPI000B3C72B4|nr:MULTISPECIES: alpha/beta hydrolase [unclassified Winogradskyella]ARV08586.1 alpha/beta hydrolase [Winogradskyella sp. PC-19]
MKNVILLLVCISFIQFSKAQKNNQAIYAEVSGKGQPVLFIPGFTVPGEVWKPIVKDLEKNYECHVITLAGFGGKAPIDFPWLPKVNTALKTYILDNDLKNTTIIGHSLGGTVATWLASQDDLNLKKIILVDALPAAGALMIPDYSPDKLAYDSPYNNQQLAMDDNGFMQVADAMSKGMSIDTLAQEKIKNWIIASDRKTYVYGYTDYLKLDIREGLKDITIPATIIAAEKPYGKEMATQTYKIQYQNLKNYDFIIAESSAHFVMLDQPEWFSKQIQTILSSK